MRDFIALGMFFALMLAVIGFLDQMYTTSMQFRERQLQLVVEAAREEYAACVKSRDTDKAP